MHLSMAAGTKISHFSNIRLSSGPL